jgi:hypothetical protein
MDGNRVGTELLCQRGLKCFDLELLDEIKAVKIAVGFLL